jgi:sugar phosphate isomerase/epimerase
MKLAIGQVCSLPAGFEQDVVDYAAGHCQALEIWLTKLEDYLAAHSVDEVRQLFKRNAIEAAAASFQGGVLASQAEARSEAWDLFRRRLALCQQIGITTLVVSGDIPGPISGQLVERVNMSLRQAADEGAAFDVRIALEFQAPAVYINNLQTAAALIDELQHPNLGICLDAFHFYVGPSKLEDLAYLSARNLFHVQLSDLADVPREFASDSQRILPGDGDIPLMPIVERLRQIQYEGYVSLEIMNPQIWRVPPMQLGEIGMTALRRLTGEAAMD